MVVQNDRHFVNRKAAYQYSRTPNVDCSPCKNETAAEANQSGFEIKVIHPKYYKHLKEDAQHSPLGRSKWAGF